MTENEHDGKRLTDEYMAEVRNTKNRNQSGLTSDELNKMRLEFTGGYIEKIQQKLNELSTAYQSSNQRDMQLIVDEISRESRMFRAVINHHSDEDGVYIISTENPETQ
jgi:hypothetical protein